MNRFSTRRTVEFVDTDMGGIVHFSRFFVFMETAEHEFRKALGTRVHSEIDGKPVGWPRVAASCDYRSPARFGDVLEIDVTVARKGAKSLTYRFDFKCQGRWIASGQMTSVCCVMDPTQPLRSIPIPPFIADRIEEASTEAGPDRT